MLLLPTVSYPAISMSGRCQILKLFLYMTFARYGKSNKNILNEIPWLVLHFTFCVLPVVFKPIGVMLLTFVPYEFINDSAYLDVIKNWKKITWLERKLATSPSHHSDQLKTYVLTISMPACLLSATPFTWSR